MCDRLHSRVIGRSCGSPGWLMEADRVDSTGPVLPDDCGAQRRRKHGVRRPDPASVCTGAAPPGLSSGNPERPGATALQLGSSASEAFGPSVRVRRHVMHPTLLTRSLVPIDCFARFGESLAQQSAGPRQANKPGAGIHAASRIQDRRADDCGLFSGLSRARGDAEGILGHTDRQFSGLHVLFRHADNRDDLLVGGFGAERQTCRLFRGDIHFRHHADAAAFGALHRLARHQEVPAPVDGGDVGDAPGHGWNRTGARRAVPGNLGQCAVSADGPVPGRDSNHLSGLVPAVHHEALAQRRFQSVVSVHECRRCRGRVHGGCGSPQAETTECPHIHDGGDHRRAVPGGGSVDGAP